MQKDASSYGRRHFLALFGATLALPGARLTVLVVVLAAFLGARMTSFRANRANIRGERRIRRHQQRRRSADDRAIAIQLDATRHHANIFFVQTLRGAMRAFVGAVIARLNAIDIFFVSHNVPFVSASDITSGTPPNKLAPVRFLAWALTRLRPPARESPQEKAHCFTRALAFLEIRMRLL
jgi:hypothetical protein